MQTFLWYYLKTIPKSKQKYFVYFHLTRAAGTSIKYYIKKLGYAHKILALPHSYNVRNIKFKNKNIIKFGTIRNPFSWYTSIYKAKVVPSPTNKIDYPFMKNNSFQDLFEDLVLFKNGVKGIKKWNRPWKKNYTPYEMVKSYFPEYGFYTNNFIHYYFSSKDNIGILNIEKAKKMIGIDKIIRIENLNKEFSELFENEGINLSIKEKLKASPPGDYMKYYTPEMIKEIKKRDNIIFKLFYPNDL